MTRMVTALLIVAVSAAPVWAQSDPAALDPYAVTRASAEAAPADTAAPDPAVVVADIFTRSCGRCHGTARPAIGLSLRPEDFADALIDVASKEIKELVRVDTKEPEKSYLLMKIRGDEGIIGERMPLGGKALDESAIAVVEAWIETVAAAEADTAAVAEPESPEAPEGQEEPQVPAAQEAPGEAESDAEEAE